MAKTSHVNLLFTKQSVEARNKIITALHNTLIALGIIVCLLLILTLGFATVTRTELLQLLLDKKTVAIELASSQKQINDAIYLQNKSDFIIREIQKEPPFKTYLKKSNELLHSEIAENNVSKISYDEENIGIYELRFDSFDKLDALLSKLDSLKNQPDYSNMKIEKINIKESTPSSSILRLKFIFKKK